MIEKKTNKNKNYTLLGFILPPQYKKTCKENTKLITPLALLYSCATNLDTFFIKSYSCEIENKPNKNGKDTCDWCCTFWRSFRGKSPASSLSMTEHNKIIRKHLKSQTDIEAENDILTINLKKQRTDSNKIKNKLAKKSHYWKLKCKNIEAGVMEWRKNETLKNGFITIKDDEASKWILFYEFIDELIDKEHKNEPEMAALHKELIKTETFSLGKFNKNNQKTGTRSKKISSRILNYALTLANSLGKTNYESEALLRSLPSWSTLTR